ncbi:MAG: hypothetical protein PUP91_17265 [Rhizonema sp. PD37]|nr:hypothetical protein [Rhizonema sp. PD37]
MVKQLTTVRAGFTILICHTTSEITKPYVRAGFTILIRHTTSKTTKPAPTINPSGDARASLTLCYR